MAVQLAPGRRGAIVADATFLAGYAKHDGTTTVRLVGELDLASAREAEDVALAALATLNGDAPGIIIDVSELSFCDSTGLRLLAELQDRARAHGHAITLWRPRPALRRILELSGQSDLFIIAN